MEFVRGSDVFVSLPTGSGKSLCYSLLPGVFDEVRRLPGLSIAIVVSPLVALMRDQVRAMTERNVRAVYVGDARDDVTADEICAGKYQLVFMSPESILTDLTWRECSRVRFTRSTEKRFRVKQSFCRWCPKFPNKLFQNRHRVLQGIAMQFSALVCAHHRTPTERANMHSD